MTTNIVTFTMSRFKMNQLISEIAHNCKKELNSGQIKNTSLTVQEVIQKYQLLEKKYSRSNLACNALDWKEEEKKLLFCFLFAFCHLHFKKVSEITNLEWLQISEAFHSKNILLLKYEAKSIQRNSERVHWDEKQQLLLQKHIQNGMLGKWADISRSLFFESQGETYKTPKQCREHWYNHMNMIIKRGEWHVEQDIAILQSALDYGHKWARVVDLLDGKRTEHMIKNRFHSLLTCCTKIIGNQAQRKNEAQIIKILINQLHQKKKLLKKCHSQPPHNISEEISNHQNGLKQAGFPQKIRQQMQKLDLYKADGNREGFQNECPSHSNAEIFEQVDIEKRDIKGSQYYASMNHFPIYFQFQNNCFVQPITSSYIVSQFYNGFPLFYQHL